MIAAWTAATAFWTLAARSPSAIGAVPEPAGLVVEQEQQRVFGDQHFSTVAIRPTLLT